MYQNYGSYTPPIKQAILRDRLYVPAEHVYAHHLEAYEHYLEVGKDPLTDEPITQKYSFHEFINAGDKAYYAFARGDLAKMRSVFHDFQIIDQRLEVPMKNKLRIKFPTGFNYRSYQYPAIETFNLHDSGLIKAPPRSGKPVWVENLVTMGDGSLKKLKDIQLGEKVMTHEGRSREVLAIYEQPKQPMLKLSTFSGKETFTAVDHPYLTPEGFVQAQHLKVGMSLIHRSFNVPASVRKVEEFALAGFFCGDGTTLGNNASVSTRDSIRINAMLKIAESLGFKAEKKEDKNPIKVPKVNFSEGIRDWLRASELAEKGAYDKYVPSWVFKGSNEQIIHFLSTYFSCDGTVSSRGKSRNLEQRSDTCIEIYSVSKLLLEGTQTLFSRLGIKTRLRKKKGKYKNQVHQSWRLSFSTQDDVVKFRDLSIIYGDKCLKLKQVKGYRTEPTHPTWADELEAITPVESLDCRCLTVDEDHTFISDDFVVHNTLMMAATICLDQQKTIILAHQTDLLVQMYDTLEKFTNLKDIRSSGNPIVGFPGSFEDFDNLDVCLCTKQTFDHITNKALGRSVQRMFGSVLIDESHYIPGPVYSQFVNRFDAKYRRGATATPARKDGLHFILYEVVGPIIYEVPREAVGFVPMEVLGIRTHITPTKKKHADMVTELCDHDSRNRFIAAWMKKDIDEGHTIFAVTDRKEHTTSFANRLKDMGISAQAFNGKFTQKSTRKNILDDVRNGRTSVLVSMRQMATGLDIPRADTFYNLTPSSNAVSKGEDAGEGGYEQQCTRILTPFEGKKKALVRDFLDETGISWGAWNVRKSTYAKLGATVRFAKDDELGKSDSIAPVYFDTTSMGFNSF